MKPTKLTASQMRMKRVLKPIVESLLTEAELDLKPTKIPNMDKIFEKYGILDVLYTAHLYYKGSDEEESVKMVTDMIKVYRNHMKTPNI